MSGLSTTQSLVWENQLAVLLLFRAFRQRPHHLTSVRSSGRDGLNPALSKGQMGSLWKIDPLGQLRRGCWIHCHNLYTFLSLQRKPQELNYQSGLQQTGGYKCPLGLYDIGLVCRRWAAMMLKAAQLSYCCFGWGLMELNHCYLGPLCTLALLDAMYFKWLYSRGEGWGKQLL